MNCIVALIEKNLEIILTRFLNENYTSLGLECDGKILDFWPKYKIGFRPKDFNIAELFFKNFSFMTCAKA